MEKYMKNLIAKILMIFAFIGFSLTSSKALVLDLYSVSGVNTPEKRALKEIRETQ